MVLVGKNPPANAGDIRDVGLIPGPWKRKWQLTSVFLPGKSHGRRSLALYSPLGRKESDTTERLHFFCVPRYSWWVESLEERRTFRGVGGGSVDPLLPNRPDTSRPS